MVPVLIINEMYIIFLYTFIFTKIITLSNPVFLCSVPTAIVMRLRSVHFAAARHTAPPSVNAKTGLVTKWNVCTVPATRVQSCSLSKVPTRFLHRRSSSSSTVEGINTMHWSIYQKFTIMMMSDLPELICKQICCPISA